MLSEKRDEAAATAFFKQAIDNNYFPKKCYGQEWRKFAELENINSY